VSAYTSAQIEAVMGIPASTLRGWVHRGHIVKIGRDLYDGDSVIARWRRSQATTSPGHRLQEPSYP